MATRIMAKDDLVETKVAITRESDWTKTQAMVLPKEGYFKGKEEHGRYGPIFPKTPACYGFSVVAKVKPGREQAIRDYGTKIEEAVKADPSVLAPLRPPLALVRCRLGTPLHVSGHLRHRFRQIPRGRGGPLRQDWHHHGFCKPRRMAGGL